MCYVFAECEGPRGLEMPQSTEESRNRNDEPPKTSVVVNGYCQSSDDSNSNIHSDEGFQGSQESGRNIVSLSPSPIASNDEYNPSLLESTFSSLWAEINSTGNMNENDYFMQDNF